MSSSELVEQQDFSDVNGLSKSVSTGSLGALLEQEYFLLKVLKYVMDDGVHECRLVCRQWREVCRKLPVQIRADVSLRITEVVKMAAKEFPDAASLCLDDRSRIDGMNADALTSLPRLTNLHTLHVPFLSGRPIAERLHPILQSMNRLRSLSIRSDDEITYSILMDALKCLVHVTFLDLHAPGVMHSCPEPITELQGLLYLSGNIQSLVRSDARLIFPSLNRLTALRFDNILNSGTQDWAVQLKSIHPYAASLRSLDIRMCSARHPFQGWSALASFSRLEKLSMCHLLLRDPDFCVALLGLNRLTEVMIADTVHTDGPTFVDSVFALTGLQSLIIDPCKEIVTRRGTADALAATAHMTRLAVTGSMCGKSLPYLTEMVDLEVTIAGDAPVNLPYALSCMPNLMCLRIHNQDSRLLLPSSALQPLKKLKTLKLWKVDVQSDLLQVLGTLPELTELSFVPQVSRFHVQNRFYAQLSFLSNLTVLEIPSDWPVIGFLIRPLVSRMPRLRRIVFIADGDSVKFCLASLRLICTDKSIPRPVLFQTFPCLRSICFMKEMTYKRDFNDTPRQIIRLL